MKALVRDTRSPRHRVHSAEIWGIRPSCTIVGPVETSATEPIRTEPSDPTTAQTQKPPRHRTPFHRAAAGPRRNGVGPSPDRVGADAGMDRTSLLRSTARPGCPPALWCNDGSPAD